MTLGPSGLYRVRQWDTPEHLAERFTRDVGRAWELAEYNPAHPWLRGVPFAKPTPLHAHMSDLVLPPLWRAGTESGAVPHFFPADHAGTYRGRILLRGTASLASSSRVAEELHKLGFDGVIVYPADELPADWPAAEREELTGIAKKTVFAQGVWAKPSQLVDLEQDDRVTFLGAWLHKPPVATFPTPAPGAAAPGASTAAPAPAASSKPAPGGNVDEWARTIILGGAYPRALPGQVPNLAEIQTVQGIASFDGAYGRWKESQAQNAHNWGAIHCCMPDKTTGECPPGSFLRDDYNARTGKRYAVCFKSYASDEEGAADLVRHTHAPKRPLTGAALPYGDLARTMAAMYDEHYFGGFTPDRERAILQYAQAVFAHVQRIAKNLGEDLAVRIGQVPPKQGALPPPPTSGLVLPAGATEPPPSQGSRVGLMIVGAVVLVGGVMVWRHTRQQAQPRASHDLDALAEELER